MAKKYFKLIQAVHHKEIIDKAINTQCPPIGMTKQANKLSDFIKPAAPTEQTREKIKLNTEKWMESNLTILQDHYVETIAQYSNLNRNEVALQVAFHWAQKRYGGRWSPNTTTAIESLLTSVIPATKDNTVIPKQESNLTTGIGQTAKTRSAIEDSKTTFTLLDPNNEEQFPALLKTDKKRGTLNLGKRKTIAETLREQNKKATTIEEHPSIADSAMSRVTSTPPPLPQRLQIRKYVCPFPQIILNKHNLEGVVTQSGPLNLDNPVTGIKPTQD